MSNHSKRIGAKLASLGEGLPDSNPDSILKTDVFLEDLDHEVYSPVTNNSI